MPARLSSLFDPLVRLLVLAIILASIVPVSGEAVPVETATTTGERSMIEGMMKVESSP